MAQRWEYQTQIIVPSHFRPGVDSFQSILNDYGQAGWELVDMIRVTADDYMSVFKRPIEAS